MPALFRIVTGQTRRAAVIVKRASYGEALAREVMAAPRAPQILCLYGACTGNAHLLAACTRTDTILDCCVTSYLLTVHVTLLTQYYCLAWINITSNTSKELKIAFRFASCYFHIIIPKYQLNSAITYTKLIHMQIPTALEWLSCH